jgi:hypothetical protein
MSQNSRQPFGAFGAGEQDGFELFVEDFAVEKKDGAERLVPLAPTARTVCVEAATFRSEARWMRKVWISFAPIWAGCFL